MLAAPLAALQRLRLLKRGSQPITAAARLSSSTHCGNFSVRLLKGIRPAPFSISTHTFCASAATDKMSETNANGGAVAATMDEVEVLRKQVEDLKVRLDD